MKRERQKKYVTVDVRFSEDGRLRPLQIVFDAEHIYEIDRVKNVCRRAADECELATDNTGLIRWQGTLPMV